jgi:hypothetical protein
MRRDDFNIEDLQIEHAASVANQLVSKRRPRRKGEFVMVPLEWMHRLAGARYKATATLALPSYTGPSRNAIIRSRWPTAYSP